MWSLSPKKSSLFACYFMTPAVFFLIYRSVWVRHNVLYILLLYFQVNNTYLFHEVMRLQVVCNNWCISFINWQTSVEKIISFMVEQTLLMSVYFYVIKICLQQCYIDLVVRSDDLNLETKTVLTSSYLLTTWLVQMPTGLSHMVIFLSTDNIFSNQCSKVLKSI